MTAGLFSMKKITDYQSERSIGFRLRQKRSRRIVDLIERVYANRGQVNLADIGGTREYWNIMPLDYLQRRRVHITIVNLAAAEDGSESRDPVFSYVQGDGCNLKEVKQNQFDIAHSNSVIEHVGDSGKMADFAKEISRIAASYYVQTPNYFYPIEPHFMFPFFHWLPLAVRLRLTMRFRLGCFPKASSPEEAKSHIELCRLLTKKQLAGLFPDARLYEERLFLLVKSFIMIRNRIP